jgi:hypothetical protein
MTDPRWREIPPSGPWVPRSPLSPVQSPPPRIGRKLSVSVSAIVAFGLIAAAVMTQSIQPTEPGAPSFSAGLTVTPPSPLVSPQSPTVSPTASVSDGYPRATHEAPPTRVTP